MFCHHVLTPRAPLNSGTTGMGRNKLPTSGLHSQLIISLLPCLREELSIAALSFHLVRFVMCG